MLISLGLVLGFAAAGCSGGGTPAVSASALSRSAASVSARLILPARTMTAGSRMSGQVVVENNTGRAIDAAGCLSLFQVALVGSSYDPPVAWFTCLQHFVIPAGRSSYRVTITASYGQCSQDRHSKSVRCLPDGRPAPLPPGMYRAVLFQFRHLVPAPPPIAVRVTRAAR